jgi:fatty-acyl-CoA synthase
MVIPGEAFDPLLTLETVQAERCTSLYGVPSMFIAELDLPRFGELRPLDAAHRDHGRLAVPGGGDEEGAVGHAHAEVTICYGMTETSPVSTQTATDDPLDKRVARSAACTRTWRSRSSTRAPGRSSRAARRASCARAATR